MPSHTKAERKRKTPEELREESKKRIAAREAAEAKRLKAAAEFKKTGAFRSSETGKLSGGIISDDRTFLGLGQDQTRELAEQQRRKDAPVVGLTPPSPEMTTEERRRGFAEATGSQDLLSELKADISAPLSEPQPLSERFATIGLKPSEALANTLADAIGRITGKRPDVKTMDQIVKTPLGKALGLAILGTGVAAAGAVVAPFVASFAARSAIFKAVTGKGGSVLGLRTAVEGVAIFTVGRGVFDFRGDEMDILRQGIKKVVEDGERIEAAMRNGFPSGDTIELLTTMAEEVSSADSRIKEIGNNNLEYRMSREYELDHKNARSAREALLRRVLAVENIAATGQAALNPEALLFDASQFGGQQ